jgi:Putative zinc-finger
MVDNEEPNDEVWPPMGPHEEFLELCALSAGGGLTPEEQKRLDEHLAGCPDCREAMKQFETVVDQAIPAIASELAPETPQENSAFSQEAAEASFFKRLSEEDEKSRNHLRDVEPWLSPLVVRRSRKFRRSFDRYHFWVPLAAGLVLCLSLGILAYRMGKHRGFDVARNEQGSAIPLMTPTQESFEAANRERDAVNGQLAERDKAIAALRREITQKSSENAKFKAFQSAQQLAFETNENNQKELAEERDRVAQRAAAGQEALEASERKLKSLERERSEDVIHRASLEVQVAELSRGLKERERTTEEQQELLARDRDIRELMGARDLYITEVHDVLRTGETQKAFGRVFYTKGKSLIFYAYDLNDLPGLKAASTFQAWGSRGPNRAQAFKLGMFFEDNVAKKRWVMKFNDRKTLDQIDAVFVTIEPRGGSSKPSGAPLLYAYLNVSANHP